MKTTQKVLLIAPCGMNCGICIGYLRDKNKCVGCRGTNENKPVTRVKCRIKTCETFKNGEAEFCYECESFPCKIINHLDTRYKTKYKMSMIENLENIKETGIDAFLEKEDERWKCPECGGVICVHRGYCIDCEKK